MTADYFARSLAALAAALAGFALAQHAHGLDRTLCNVFAWADVVCSAVWLFFHLRRGRSA